ncbi:hypothetical protein IC582_007018 [Cucumis melo]|uniref:Uncharacterized protein n=1 Tax=Cucumis melo var. makuwa TaxID=1194695 RepID=A0A5D3E545_CUCMM|nr:uncharacterized protein E6C27_scaffold92G001760 [Cucumis melo var. makuwa]TYK31243.1 uncharacterized protein E5676_scaffold455G005320 [Cucumis melo var. makuwa]
MEYDNREAQDPASLSFPVGLVLLLTFLFCMCCFFCCCLHWEKLRSFLGCPDHLHHHHPPIPPPHSPAALSPPDKFSPIHTIWKENRPQSVSVLMPGDEVPRFIALACPPCATAAAALVEIVVQKPSQSISDSSL